VELCAGVSLVESPPDLPLLFVYPAESVAFYRLYHPVCCFFSGCVRAKVKAIFTAVGET